MRDQRHYSFRSRNEDNEALLRSSPKARGDKAISALVLEGQRTTISPVFQGGRETRRRTSALISRSAHAHEHAKEHAHAEENAEQNAHEHGR